MSMAYSVYLKPPGSWADRAACAEYEKETWFPIPNNTGRRGGKDKSYYRTVREAKRICADCPVLEECRQYILTHPQHGIWAGMTESERGWGRTNESDTRGT